MANNKYIPSNKRKIIIVIANIIVIGLASYGAYRYFIFQAEKPEPLTRNKEKPEGGITINYPHTSLFYEKDDQIWQIDLKSGAKKQIIKGIRPVVSPDKTKFAYTYQGWNKYFKPTEDNLTGIHIFNIATGQEKLLKHYDKDAPVWQVTWSPNSKYLVVDEGTSSVRSKTVIDSNTGEEILSFTTYRDSYTWIDNNEIVFSDPQSIAEPRPYGGGGGSGITIINLKGQKRVLQAATNKREYSFIQLINDKIYFSLREVESPEGWLEPAKQTISYWTMDKMGNNLKAIAKIEGWEEKIKRLLPPPYNDYKSLQYVTPLANNKDWVAFVLNKAGKTQLEDEIFIMDTSNPQSIKKIGDGTWPSW